MPANRLKMWDAHTSWKEAEQKWDKQARAASQLSPNKGLANLPSMQGITKETAKNLKWKSFKWMLLKDHQKEVIKGFIRHPFKYGWRYLKSLFKKKSHLRQGDFFLYGIQTVEEFESLLLRPDSLLVLGFSYCHKPFECPSGRFSSECIHDPDNNVCRQCFIGKAFHALPTKNTSALVIPTVHYIGGKIFEVVHQNPNKKILFLITACELTLEMFGDWGNMVGVKGIGVRLDGRICNTMKAFELSEQGIKPGLTVVRDETQKSILNLIRLLRENTASHKVEVECE